MPLTVPSRLMTMTEYPYPKSVIGAPCRSCVVDLTVKNVGKTDDTAASLFTAQLLDGDGRSYNPELFVDGMA
ncbi:hypothetical protein STSP_54090 [Streptomyces jeddahensis]|uniref:Uncharacterized protein n=1 Tax=Streptomyces jeddahensis TaxID=1716141 RepID=A0A177HK22_9ACTN|nr:hypothetical protein STSP_54090 [Streptomyces jeddahensis]